MEENSHAVGGDFCHLRGRRSWVYTHAHAQTHVRARPAHWPADILPLCFPLQGAKAPRSCLTATQLRAKHTFDELLFLWYQVFHPRGL